MCLTSGQKAGESSVEIVRFKMMVPCLNHLIIWGHFDTRHHVSSPELMC